MKTKLIAILIVTVLLLIIMSQNTYVISFHLLFWKITMSQLILIAFSAMIGFVIGYLTCLLSIKK